MADDKTLGAAWRALGLLRDYIHSAGGEPDHEADLVAAHEALIATAYRIADQRELLAAWMFANSYATGHGDTVESLLAELDWQHKERLAAMSSAIRILSDTNRSDTARILDARDRLVIGRGAARARIRPPTAKATTGPSSGWPTIQTTTPSTGKSSRCSTTSCAHGVRPTLKAANARWSTFPELSSASPSTLSSGGRRYTNPRN